MLISAIVLIVLRLFSIQWFIRGLVMMASIIFDLAPRRAEYPVMAMVPSILTVLASIIMWFAAPSLARLIAGKYDAMVSAPLPPLRDLYAFAFVFLGINFVLQSLGDAILRFHYAIVTSALADFSPERQMANYDLVRSLITLVGGLLCIIFGRTWAGKLSGTRPEPSAQP